MWQCQAPSSAAAQRCGGLVRAAGHLGTWARTDTHPTLSPSRLAPLPDAATPPSRYPTPLRPQSIANGSATAASLNATAAVFAAAAAAAEQAAAAGPSSSAASAAVSGSLTPALAAAAAPLADLSSVLAAYVAGEGGGIWHPQKTE